MSVTPAHLITSAGGATAEKVDGHVCEAEEALVEMTDGARATFRVLRATDLKRFPVRITSISNSAHNVVVFKNSTGATHRRIVCATE
jgi:hypothetical protein